MRFIVIGAGAVGGTIGGRLAESGHDVVLVARGEHAAAMRTDGLRLQTPDGDVVVRPAVTKTGGVALREDDVLILATKTQHTAQVIAEVSAAAPIALMLPILCAQNGVENERIAARVANRVYGVYVVLPATHLEPGVVQSEGAPFSGILDIGRYPTGVDDDARQYAEALSHSRFRSRPVERVMSWKYAKLLQNLDNSLDALTPPDDPDRGELADRLREEGEACFRAAGIEAVPPEQQALRRGDDVQIRPVGTGQRSGSSSWQSLARSAGSIESDYLNGEIALLGRRHGVATPVNVVLQRLAGEAARDRRPPGSMRAADIIAAISARQP